MKINSPNTSIKTHAGGSAVRADALQTLKRTVLACLLWETGFYEDGTTTAERIKSLVHVCDPKDVAQLALKARNEMKLRHAPLLLMRELARHPKKPVFHKVLSSVIQRADELTEFLAIYWSEKRQPLSKQVKLGLANAFPKFSAYQLAKYNRPNKVKLRDVLFLSHAKPKDEEQAATWKKLVDGTLEPPNTWEVMLSTGKDKKATFMELLEKKELGYLALLRNLRNMQESGVPKSIVEKAILSGAKNSKALPFRFIAAARAVPSYELVLDQAMALSVKGLEKLEGKTVVVVDVSGSMDQKLSGKSDLSRLDAACALAALVSGICEDVRVFSFSQKVVEVPRRQGMALIDSIRNSQAHGGTYLGVALKDINAKVPDATRMIVITDEQSHDSVGAPNKGCRGYMLNVASYQNGVGYGPWTRITGFSEAVVNYIQESEKMA